METMLAIECPQEHGSQTNILDQRDPKYPNDSNLQISSLQFCPTPTITQHLHVRDGGQDVCVEMKEGSTQEIT